MHHIAHNKNKAKLVRYTAQDSITDRPCLVAFHRIFKFYRKHKLILKRTISQFILDRVRGNTAHQCIIKYEALMSEPNIPKKCRIGEWWIQYLGATRFGSRSYSVQPYATHWGDCYAWHNDAAYGSRLHRTKYLIKFNTKHTNSRMFLQMNLIQIIP
jgi:hypothetical protein